MVIDIVRVHAHQRGALGQAIALQQILPGKFDPTLGHRLLHRHPTARRQMQGGEVELLELFVIQQRVKQGVHPGHGGERIFRQLFDQPRNIARVGDQDVLPAKLDKQQAVHGQGEDVIERQRGDHQLFATMQQRPVGGVHLLEVRQHVAVGQHRPFRNPGGAAGVLQEGQILGYHFRFHVLHPVAVVQRPAEGDGVWQVIFWHQTFNVLNDEVNQRPFRGGELIAHPRQNDVFHLGFVDHFLEGVREVRDNHNCRCAAVVQLMLQLARGIQRVNVNHDHPGAQNAKQRHRILQQVRHHQRDPVAFFQA